MSIQCPVLGIHIPAAGHTIFCFFSHKINRYKSRGVHRNTSGRTVCKQCTNAAGMRIYGQRGYGINVKCSFVNNRRPPYNKVQLATHLFNLPVVLFEWFIVCVSHGGVGRRDMAWWPLYWSFGYNSMGCTEPVHVYGRHGATIYIYV